MGTALFQGPDAKRSLTSKQKLINIQHKPLTFALVVDGPYTPVTSTAKNYNF